MLTLYSNFYKIFMKKGLAEALKTFVFTCPSQPSGLYRLCIFKGIIAFPRFLAYSSSEMYRTDISQTLEFINLSPNKVFYTFIFAPGQI